MNLKNPTLTSLIVPLLAFVAMSVGIHQTNSEARWSGYSLLLLFVFALWGITAFIGAFIFYLTERRRIQIIVTAALQTMVFGGLSYFMFTEGPATIDKDENMKMNRLMVDFDKGPDDSLITIPNSIRIAYKKLESQFPNPNDFKLSYFGSEKEDSASRTVYFSYKIQDSVNLYSKIVVHDDTAYIFSFNKSINDSEFLNEKERLDKWSLRHMKELLDEIKKANGSQ